MGNKEAHKKACEHWNEGGLAKVWIDKDGYLCIEYESGKWWHYNDKGEWWWMKVGKYQIGRFHAIIRKEYADGSVDYWQGYKTLLNEE